MADIIDQCTETLSEELTRRVNGIRGNLQKNRFASATECEDCGEPIPEKRRMAVPGCDRCVECQEFFERTA